MRGGPEPWITNCKFALFVDRDPLKSVSNYESYGSPPIHRPVGFSLPLFLIKHISSHSSWFVSLEMIWAIMILQHEGQKEIP